MSFLYTGERMDGGRDDDDVLAQRIPLQARPQLYLVGKCSARDGNGRTEEDDANDIEKVEMMEKEKSRAKRVAREKEEDARVQ